MLAVEWVPGSGNNNDVLSAAPIPSSESAPPALQPAPVQRHWKLVVTAVVVAIAGVASVISLLDARTYLSRTRLRMVARGIMLGRSITTQPAVSNMSGFRTHQESSARPANKRMI